MKAIFVRAPFKFEFREVEIPEPKEGEVLLRCKFCGICGTDIHMAKGWAKDWERFGHELVAEVSARGPGVTDLQKGDIVVIQPTTACGVCEACMNGDYKTCRSYFPTRIAHAFAEYIIADRRSLYKVEGLNPLHAILAEPLTVALDLVKGAGVKFNEDIAVLGPGTIGLMTLKLCKMMGVRRIFVTGTKNDLSRFPLAEELGADTCINVIEEDPAAKIKKVIGKDGLDRVLVTAPPTVIPQALDMVKFGGVVTYIGFTAKEDDSIVKINLNQFHFRRLQLRACYEAPAFFFPTALDLLKRKEIDPAKFITHTFEFEKLPEAIKFVASQADGIIKAAIKF